MKEDTPRQRLTLSIFGPYIIAYGGCTTAGAAPSSGKIFFVYRIDEKKWVTPASSLFSKPTPPSPLPSFTPQTSKTDDFVPSPSQEPKMAETRRNTTWGVVPSGLYNVDFLGKNIEEPPETSVEIPKKLPVVYSHSAGVYHDQIYIFGGVYADNRYSPQFVELSFSTGDWSSIESQNQPKPRKGHTCCVLHNAMYVFGGQEEDGTMSQELYKYTFAQKSWTLIQTNGYSPPGRANHAMAIYDNMIYVYGGNDGKADLDELISFNPGSNTWTCEQPASVYRPGPKQGHSLLCHGQRLFLVGGSSLVPNALNLEVNIYDCKDRNWKMVEAGYDPVSL